MKKALIISVGGSPSPIIQSISQQQPDYLILFASSASRTAAVEQIIPVLPHIPRDHEFIVTPDEQDLEVCVATLRDRLPGVLKTWRLGYDDLAADYTGGTKTMSAAMVLSLSRHIDNFSYVGGTQRDKGGLGIVQDGHGQMLQMKNPWNELAIETLADYSLLFNRCRYLPAAELAEETARRTPARKQLFDALKVTAEAYNLWDGFQYSKGLNIMRQADSRLRSVSAESAQRQLNFLQQHVTANLALLEKIVTEHNLLVRSATADNKHHVTALKQDSGQAIICDLLANAVRRAEIEHKYDDAVARLYSAIEKMAKVRLKLGYGINNSNVRPEQVPELLRDELVRECTTTREELSIKLPLHKSYQLLAAFDDSVGSAYSKNETELAQVLSIRNMSLLAHGFEPVSSDTYTKLLAIALDFLGIEKEKLPIFPSMKWTENGI